MASGEVRKNVAWFTLSNVVASIIGMLSSILVARYMPKTDFSPYSLALTLFSVEAGIVLGGVSNFLMEEIAKHPERIRDATKVALKVRTVLFWVFFALFSLLSYAVYGSKEVLELFVAGNVYVFATYVQSTFSTALIPRVKSDFASISNIVYFVCLFIGEVLLILAGKMNAINTVMVIGASRFVSLVASFFLYRKYVADSGDVTGSHEYSLKEVVEKIKYYFLVAVVGTLSGNLDILLLPVILGISAVGLYRVVSFSFRLVIPISTIIISSVFSPLVKLKHRGFEKEHARLSTVSVLLVLSSGLSAVTILNYFGTLLFSVVFENKYYVSPFIKYATPAIPFYVLVPILMYILYSEGRKAEVFLWNVVEFILYTTLIVLLGKQFGINGILLSVMIAHGIFSGVLFKYVASDGILSIKKSEAIVLTLSTALAVSSYAVTGSTFFRSVAGVLSLFPPLYFLWELVKMDGFLPLGGTTTRP